MRIQVNTYYQGFNTHEQTIKPGIYAVGDARLFGIEDYLVNVQQKAEYLEDAEESEAVVEPVAEATPVISEVTDDTDREAGPDVEHRGRTIKTKKAK